MFVFVLFLCIIASSCTQTVVVPFEYDVALCSEYPSDIINGKTLHSHLGLGGYNIINNRVYTYPVGYIGSNYSIGTKDAVALGGLDLSRINPNFKKALLNFFINYKDTTRKNILLFVRPILSEWNDADTSFNFFYNYDYQSNQFILTQNVSTDEDKCLLIAFDVKANENNDYTQIPFKSSYRTVSINVTQIMKYYINHQDEFHGFLLDPMWQTDWRYCTTNENNEVCDTGIMEIAPSNWLTFDQTDDDPIYYMHNNALGKVRFVPRIEFRY